MSNPKGVHNVIRFYEKALKAHRQLATLEKDNRDRALANEQQELYLKTLISFYIAVFYFEQRKYAEAHMMGEHTMTEIEGCLDFTAKSGLQTTDLESKILPQVMRLVVDSHSKTLQVQADTVMKV